MRTTLMNFGDNIRVVSDVSGAQKSIAIGEMIAMDLHEVHYNMINAGSATDTLIIVPEDAEMSDKLKGIMGLMAELREGDEAEMIQRFTEVMGPNPESLRPTRSMMQLALREVARKEVRTAKAAWIMSGKKVPIREEGDKETRKEPKPREDDKDDKALAILVPEVAAKAKKRVIQRERL